MSKEIKPGDEFIAKHSFNVEPGTPQFSFSEGHPLLKKEETDGPKLPVTHLHFSHLHEKK